MKNITILLLFFFLNGCALIPGFAKKNTINQSKKSDLRIASNIPANTMACPQIQRSKKPESIERSKIEQETRNYFISEDFKNLNSRYEIYRKRENRTSSGLWKLPFFYNGFSNLPGSYFSDDYQWNRTKEKVERWITAYPKSPAPYIAYSKLLMSRGWSFRGTSFAQNVPDSAWEPFYKNLDESKKILEENKDNASIDPEWYATMIDIAKATSWEPKDVRTIFHEAVKREPYYYPTYLITTAYLYPKWHGSLKAIEEFTDDVVRITSKCEKDSMYARIYWSAINSDPLLFSREDSAVAVDNISWGYMQNVNWEKMSNGFDSLVEKYPDSWNSNHYAKFSCFARDKATVNKIFLKLTPEMIDENAWMSLMHVNPMACRVWGS